MKNKIEELLQLQITLNNLAAGINWTSFKTEEGKIINWHDTLLLETVEAIDSTPWKHWKSIESETDMDNLKIELVDIYHFLMSHLIVTEGVEKTSQKLYNALKTFEPMDIFYYRDFNHTAKFFMLELLKNELEKVQNNDALIYTFINMLEHVNLDFDTLYLMYIKKNVLNIHRQKNGYKEGTYIKYWNNIEDNKVVQEELLKHPEVSFNELLEIIQQIYNQMTKTDK